MRLSKLKLAGFKSFVDPTTVSFPSNLTGVVGPNGCGKSNIIDAVRWVLGESSAKHLRGESMADVVFNGSSGRKPSSQATIELVFDNSEGRIKGEYARYSEIGIKRTVNREGASNYYLNGARCRKKDITDLLLGTGLGARSYSIIEQGMISRVIEAKPEDLRAYLEEAAGISKYKERRRETENRIKHTRENLDRIQDIRDELGKQLEKLQRQAEVAEKYKVLRKEENLLHSQCLALQWQKFDADFNEVESIVKSLASEINVKQTDLHSLESDLERFRVSHREQHDILDDKRKSFYALATEIAKIEQIIANEKEKRTKLFADLEMAKSELSESEEALNDDELEVESLKTQQATLSPELDRLREALTQAQKGNESIETKRREWQVRWDACSQQAANSSQQAHIEKTKIHHLEEKLQSLEERIKTLNDNTLHEAKKQLIRDIELARAKWQTTESESREATEKLEAFEETIKSLKDKQRELQYAFKEASKTLQTHITEKVGLEALQKAALGYERSDSESLWLKEQGLSDNKRLAETLVVEAGFEKAVETVLADELDAILVDDTHTLLSHLDALSSGHMRFISAPANEKACAGSLGTLAAKVKNLPLSLERLLSKVYTASTLTEAMTQLDGLQDNESIILPNGIWLSKRWLRVHMGTDSDESVIKREQQIQSLNQVVAMHEATVQGFEVSIAETEEALQQAEEMLALQRKLVKDVEAIFAEVKSDLSIKRNRLQDIEQRQVKIAEEMNMVQKQLHQSQHELKQARKSWQDAVDSMGQDSDAKVILQEEQETLISESEAARAQYDATQQAFHECEVKFETTKSQLHSYELNIERVKGRMLQCKTKIEAINENLNRDDYPEAKLKLELDEHLNQHMEFEKAIAYETEKLKTIEASIQDYEKKRAFCADKLDDLKQQIGQKRIDSQTFLVKRSTIEEQLKEEEFDLPIDILKALPTDAALDVWQPNLNRVRDRIQRLGAINLAAIDEYETESERKRYLDTQFADLEKALITLEDAIAKIDKETRVRFQDCYEKVNQSFKALFPRLFGGGQAYLELTGDDLLDTGISVIARPPGKRNSSIHLLSGGEKAMTAVALVFAIFQLNPSPFCLLDEVDAPLDDANVSRFCNMVREMSDNTQFIIITHNKVTMEIAQTLTGVTMHEPGVSRLVSVDVDEAVRLTEA